MKKNHLLFILILPLLLSSCVGNSDPIDKIDSIDAKLEEGKIKESSSGMISDITNNIELPSDQIKTESGDNQKINIKIRDEDLELNKEKQSTSEPEPDKPLTTVDKLITQDIYIGDGKEATDGAMLTVHYHGTLTNGVVFDSSQGKTPFAFVLGAGQVIKGWDQGLLGMKEGGKRMLTIPADLAYGDRAVGNIPAGATLVFEVDLLKVQ